MTHETKGDQLAREHRALAERYGCRVDQLPLLEGMPGYSDCMPRELGDHCGGCDRCLWMQIAHAYASDGAT